MTKLGPGEGKQIAPGHTVMSGLLLLRLSTSIWSCDPRGTAWLETDQWARPSLNSLKAKESERISHSIYLFTEHKVSYNNNLCISSCFHLRIPESWWNSQPTVPAIITCSGARARRHRWPCGLPGGSFELSAATDLLCIFIFSPRPHPYQHREQPDRATAAL